MATSQLADPSPLAMLAATCRKIGEPLLSSSPVTHVLPPQRVSPATADCYPSASFNLTSSYGPVAAAEPALYSSGSPPATCASVSPPTVWPFPSSMGLSLSPSSPFPSISPTAVYQPTSPPQSMTASPPLSPSHQSVPFLTLHSCPTTMSAQPVSQCCSSCNCFPSVTPLQYHGYPTTFQPYSSDGFSSGGFSSFGPIRHRQSPSSYTPYPSHEDLSKIKLASRRSHLKAHLRGHEGERDFVCRWMNCGKSFTRSDELQRHMWTHTGVKQYECGECGKRFMRSDHLSEHQKTHSVSGYTTSGHPVGMEEFIDVLN